MCVYVCIGGMTCAMIQTQFVVLRLRDAYIYIYIYIYIILVS